MTDWGIFAGNLAMCAQRLHALRDVTSHQAKTEQADIHCFKNQIAGFDTMPLECTYPNSGRQETKRCSTSLLPQDTRSACKSIGDCLAPNNIPTWTDEGLMCNDLKPATRLHNQPIQPRCLFLQSACPTQPLLSCWMIQPWLCHIHIQNANWHTHKHVLTT